MCSTLKQQLYRPILPAKHLAGCTQSRKELNLKTITHCRYNTQTPQTCTT